MTRIEKIKYRIKPESLTDHCNLKPLADCLSVGFFLNFFHRVWVLTWTGIENLGIPSSNLFFDGAFLPCTPLSLSEK